MAGMSRQQEFEVIGHITSTVRKHIGMDASAPFLQKRNLEGYMGGFGGRKEKGTLI